MALTSLSPVQASLPLVCLDAMRLMGKYCPAESARKQILPMVFNVHTPGGDKEDKEGKEDKEDKNRRGKQQRKS
jgi:hypothetical protein